MKSQELIHPNDGIHVKVIIIITILLIYVITIISDKGRLPQYQSSDASGIPVASNNNKG